MFCQEICFWHLFCIIVLNFLVSSWLCFVWELMIHILIVVLDDFTVCVWFVWHCNMVYIWPYNAACCTKKAFNVHIWSLCLLNSIWHFRLIGQRVNDGLWHSVSLSTRGLQIIMTLDSEPASTIQLKSYLEPKDKHYFGGKIMNKYFQKGQKDHFSYSWGQIRYLHLKLWACYSVVQLQLIWKILKITKVRFKIKNLKQHIRASIVFVVFVWTSFYIYTFSFCFNLGFNLVMSFCTLY